MLLSALVIVNLLTSYQVEPATKWINSFAGPYIFTVANWENCPDVKTERYVIFNLYVAQFRNPAEVQRKLQILTGNVTTTQALTNTGKIVVRGASRSNNQWKENAIVMQFRNGICQSLIDFYPEFTRLVFKLDRNDVYKGVKPCVIGKGIYLANEVPVNWTMPNIPVVPYGLFRVTISFDWGSDAKPRRIGCMVMELTVHPKL